MKTPRELVDTFYSAFAKKDAEAMCSCYADGVVFSDPVFLTLRGDEAKSMWRMLCGRAKDLTVTHEVLEATDTRAKVRWIANYTFSTGRPVENRIVADITVADGKIVSHHDVFDLWKWTRMALGAKGALLGWSPIVQNVVRKTARAGLDTFMASQKK